MGVTPTAPTTRFYHDHYDVSGFLNAGNIAWTPELIEHGVFTDTGKRQTASGKYTSRAGQTALFDGAANQIDAILAGLAVPGAAHYNGRTPNSLEGRPIYETIERLASKPIVAAEGQMLMINVDWAQAGPTSRSIILRNATVTGTGNGTGRNQGITPATSEYQVVMRVLSGTFTSITIQVQQSSDDGAGDAYALITGLANTFSAAGVFRATFSGATEAWKRAAVTAFTGTNALILVTGGRVKGT